MIEKRQMFHAWQKNALFMLPAPSLVTRKYMCQSAGRYLAVTVAALPGISTRFPVRRHSRITVRTGHAAPALVWTIT